MTQSDRREDATRKSKKGATTMLCLLREHFSGGKVSLLGDMKSVALIDATKEKNKSVRITVLLFYKKKKKMLISMCEIEPIPNHLRLR